MVRLRLNLIYESADDVSIFINAPVAQERPPAPNLVAVLQIDGHNNVLFIAVAGAIEEFALRTCYKTAAPKPYALCVPAGVGL